MDIEPVRRKTVAPSIGPFDCSDGVAIYVVVKSCVFELGGGQAVEVGVDQWKASLVFVDQCKCGAAHLRRFGEQSVGDAFDQGGLASPQFTEQGEDFASLKECSQAAAQAVRLLRRSKHHAPRFADRGRPSVWRSDGCRRR